MFTDMVGYSSLSQRNEALALKLLEEHRNILRPFFSKYSGREIETAGDLFFVEFNSAVEAAECAIEIQTALHERNAAQSEDEKILIRIGIHIGDVVYVEKHVHGDGVNIAARIEPLAKPGGICVSEDVARQIHNKVSYPVLSTGKHTLKNISTPIEIFHIQLPWTKEIPSAKKMAVSGKKAIFSLSLVAIAILAALALVLFKSNTTTTTPPEFSELKLRLAVLPLDNISADEKDEYFADGMTEELISSLSKITDLRVIARSSIMKYKGIPIDISAVGKELMVGTVLAGTVRQMGTKARISVQLIDVATQEYIWSTEYDRNLQDIFVIQSEIAQSVASKLKIILASSEKTQLEKNYTENTEAFQEYLLGKHFLNNRTPNSIQTAVEHFEKSISLDPDFALAYANLSYCYTLIGAAGYGSDPGYMAAKKAREAVAKALEIDETLAEAHAALGYLKFRIDWDWDAADKEFMRAIELKPGYATAHEWYALFLAIQRRLDESLKEINKAHDLDPLSLSVNSGLGRIYHFRNEIDKSIAQFKKTIELDPRYAEAIFGLGLAYLKNKDYAKAEAEVLKASELANRRPVMLGVLGAIYTKEGKTQEAENLLMELLSPPLTYDKKYAASSILVNSGRVDEALKILNELINIKYGLLVYMNVERSFYGPETDSTLATLRKRMGFKRIAEMLYLAPVATLKKIQTKRTNETLQDEE
jgi:TolB-like protein/Flp pilus assembly protein TadD